MYLLYVERIKKSYVSKPCNFKILRVSSQQLVVQPALKIEFSILNIYYHELIFIIIFRFYCHFSNQFENGPEIKRKIR